MTTSPERSSKNPKPKKICNDRTPPRTQTLENNQTLPEETMEEADQVNHELTKSASNKLMQEKEKPPEQNTKKMHNDDMAQPTQSQDSHTNDTTRQHRRSPTVKGRRQAAGRTSQNQ